MAQVAADSPSVGTSAVVDGGRNGISKLQGRGGVTFEEGDGDGTVVLGVVVPGHLVGRAGSEDFTSGWLGDGVETTGLSEGVANKSQEGGGGGCELHLDWSFRRVFLRWET